MSMKLYVGGLPYQCTEDDIKDYFSPAGSVVSVAIITDKMSGRSRGFGFVEMETEDEGNKAVEMFNGTDFQGRKLTVNEARPLQNRDDKKSY